MRTIRVIECPLWPAEFVFARARAAGTDHEDDLPMDTPEKVYYEDDALLVTASRLIVKGDARTLLIADIREPRVEQKVGVHGGSDATVLARLRNWVEGARVSLWWDTLLVQYRGRVEELDAVPWRDGSPAFENEYASTWHSNPAVRTKCERLRVIAAAIGAAVADYAARHPEAYAATWRTDEVKQAELQAVGSMAPTAPTPEPPKQGGGATAGIGGGLALVVLILGGLFLYQREGGKVFEDKKAPPIVPAVVSIKVSLDTGFRSHDVVLTHTHNDGTDPNGGRLTDVEMTLVLYREDGTRHELKKVWAGWDRGEAKKVNVPAHKYQKVELIGTCTAADSVGYVGKHNIQITWLWNWDRK